MARNDSLSMISFNRLIKTLRTFIMNSTQNFNIFKNLMLYTFVILIGVLVYKLQFIAILFFAAFIVASAIDPLINLLSKKMPRNIAVIAVAIIGLLLISIFLVPFINILIAQTLAFLKEAPAFWEKLASFASQTDNKGIKGILNILGLSKWVEYAQHIGVLPGMTQIMTFASTLGQNVLSSSIDLTKNFLSGRLSLIKHFDPVLKQMS